MLSFLARLASHTNWESLLCAMQGMALPPPVHFLTTVSPRQGLIERALDFFFFFTRIAMNDAIPSHRLNMFRKSNV
jgi:hypothetical protein